MIRRNFTILHWIVLWGMIAVMANSTGSDFGSWAALAAAIFSGLGVAYGVINWAKRKCQLRNPFDVYYEPKEDVIKRSYIVNASEKSQYIRVTLKLMMELYVEHVSIQFIGRGGTPVIEDLDDWYYVDNRRPANIDVYPVIDETWYWKYNSPLRRFRKSRIKIGIKYKAASSFDGEIEFGLTGAPEASARKRLPFKVNKTHETKEE